MDGPAISASHLGIRFSINRRRHWRARDFLIRGKSYTTAEVFWALRDLTFEVKPGEVVGIVGSNGTGKSTLLKLIAGVMIPDEGNVTVDGKVAPLLELSAGFAPDLTAWENIFLSGAIHGLTRSEIEDRFDQIVTFASIEKFLRTPLRHFSSGMKVRLGFSILTQLDHPIVLVDEVLAVGDKAFRWKCYDAIEEMVAEGKTLMVVSHRDADIQRFCTRALYLKEGRLIEDGSVDEVMAHYTRDAEEAG